ncbi:hypothetical protein GPJ61_04260 [Brevibacillus formosus]|uniref:hypothetical protein n=1 Tax=Brevibacillus formosus TaxID=54913 RepID=UPI001CA51E0F|nr:hypothetical protein [Brevibacillus formosus]MBW5467088.1 hypothetical protein [Brevibacillus formosus]
MDKLIIEPMKGIGKILLGMTKTEVDECLQYYTEKYEITYAKNPLCYHTKGAIQSFFQLEYDFDGKVNFIQIPSAIKNVLNCVFHNLDVFNTKTEELVEKIDKISNYDRNHRELGWTYYYPELGLSFWRPNILKESDMQEDWFKELEPSIQEDEKRNLYFECVSIQCIK